MQKLLQPLKHQNLSTLLHSNLVASCSGSPTRVLFNTTSAGNVPAEKRRHSLWIYICIRIPYVLQNDTLLENYRTREYTHFKKITGHENLASGKSLPLIFYKIQFLCFFFHFFFNQKQQETGFWYRTSGTFFRFHGVFRTNYRTSSTLPDFWMLSKLAKFPKNAVVFDGFWLQGFQLRWPFWSYPRPLLSCEALRRQCLGIRCGGLGRN